MCSSLRALLAAAAVLAAVQPAVASPPSASARVSAYREFSFEATSGWDRLSVRFEHSRGSVFAGSATGGVGGERWYACVYSSARVGWFSSCDTPAGVTFDVAPGGATGRVRFTLKDSWGDGTAVADLTLTDTGAAPTASYDLIGYGTSVTPVGGTSRLATLKGVVRVTTKRYGASRAATKTYTLSGIPVFFHDRVSASARVYPGV